MDSWSESIVHPNASVSRFFISFCSRATPVAQEGGQLVVEVGGRELVDGGVAHVKESVQPEMTCESQNQRAFVAARNTICSDAL